MEAALTEFALELKDRINEISAEPDLKQRASQFAQLIREQYEASDTSLTEIKKVTNDLVVKDPTKKTREKNLKKFLSQKSDRLVKFQELVSKEYNVIIDLITAFEELVDRVRDVVIGNPFILMISERNKFNHRLHTCVMPYLNSGLSHEPEMFGVLIEQLEILFLGGFEERTNEVVGTELPEDVDILDPLGSESNPQIRRQNGSHLHGEQNSQEHNENTGDSEVPVRKNYEEADDTEQNPPPKVDNTIKKESIRDGRNIDNNVASAVAESSTRDNDEDEDGNKFDEPEVVTISDDDGDRHDTDEIPNVGNIGSPDKANRSTRVNEEDEAGSTSDGSSGVVHISDRDVTRVSDHCDDPKHCDEIKEILVEPDFKQRIPQFLQLMREKYEVTDTILTEIKKVTDDLFVDDPTKKTPETKLRTFLSQKRNRLEEFQELASEGYCKALEDILLIGKTIDHGSKMKSILILIISEFSLFSHRLRTYVTLYLNSDLSRDPKMFGVLMGRLEILFLEYNKRKMNEVVGTELPEDVDILDPLGIGGAREGPDRTRPL